ncbi:hypothetical protein D8Y22_16660 [Salinadaptatus halalkaliphilus]|uniref:Uncharacterized protein n=1 Tax=Salinadaptatus halalkaliphilus TaxID=2419781 RepID=A0A4V3VKY0_9EURY|nr:hypothetical protein [Salinadaptatus halalkaliphilus]THE63467.1 hypothetical protein D8Y22_16660 [Salinadaptatus halalkaliphilus]
MKFKPVPDPPADFAAIETIHRAVPTEPDSVDDCCGELVAETPVSTRDDAATWLTFLRALEAAEETDTGFQRRDFASGFDADRVRRAFRERVHGVETVLEVLAEADRSLTLEEMSRYLADREARVGASRGTTGESEDDARAPRVERLLEWAVLFDLAERTDGRYRSR